MSKAIVVYDSKTGNTEKMAKAIGEGIREAGLDVEVKRVDDTSLDDLVAADAIVLGSPTYFCSMSGKMKVLIDKSIEIYPDKLQDKVGAAFTSSGDIAGGNETTLLSLIQAMLMHRMLIVGHQSGSFGAVSIGEPDEECLAQCKQFGKRIASFVKR
jgi:NAD(P)H dehydrogenase (quinone)